jgi:tRNA pseudouridine38-40 synthase
MRNLKLVIEFDGSRFHGSQRQAPEKELTVQGVMERSLFRLLGKETPVSFSGRTDAGVHALGQVVNFKTTSPIPTDRIPMALGNLLPAEIGILSVEEVPQDFHARFSARGKTYRYLILHGRSVFWQGRAWQHDRELDLVAMQKAAALLVGEHDFSSWQAAGCTASSPVKDLWELTVEPLQIADHSLVSITTSSTGFLYKMVRNLVGTLVAVGQGRMVPEDVAELLVKKDRRLAPPTAPACGLYLVKVYY